VHYTSVNGRLALVFDESRKQWYIQDTGNRDEWLAFTNQDTWCPSDAGITWQYNNDNQWINASDGLEAECLYKADGTCRTVSHGKREHIPGEGYRYVLHLNNGTYANNGTPNYYWIDRWNEVDWIKYSEVGAGIPGKPCVFPFKVNGIEFNECTAYQSPNGWPRCATKKNQDLTKG